MKSLYQKILALGIWVIILPHLGFPVSFRKILFALTGVVIMYYAYRLKRYTTHLTKDDMPERVKSFTEHNPKNNHPTENQTPHVTETESTLS